MEWAQLHRILETGPGNSGPAHQGTSPGPHLAPGEGGLQSSGPRSAHSFPEGSKTNFGAEETPVLRRPLEDLRRRVALAFQWPVQLGSSGCAWEAAAWAALLEMQRRARVESVLAWLRCELLDMRFENLQLTRTLLDLSMKMEHLKKEYEMEIAAESQCLETNALDQENEMHT